MRASSSEYVAGSGPTIGSISLFNSCAIDDTDINGIDLITWNNDGLITEFKVFIRPLQGVNLIHKMMQGMLESFKNVS